MSPTDRIIRRVRAGYRVRFREDHYGGIHAVCYPATRLYPRFLLRFHKSVKLTTVDVAAIKATMDRLTQISYS